MTNSERVGLRTRHGEPVLLEGVRAEGDLKGAFLELAVEQRFRNPTDRNVEVVYTFPLPWRAVLLGVEVVLGGKRLTGTVVPKVEAEARYEETLSTGDAAIMLEKNRDESYSLNLGNLAANEPCLITLRYAQVLQFEQGGLRVLVPTVIAPRYGDPIRDGGLRPHQVAPFSPTVDYPFNLTLRLHGELARARIGSPSHPISVAAAAEAVTVQLARQGALDRDFVLVVDQLGHDSLTMAAPDAVAPGKVAVLASFCPRLPPAADEGVAVKILVDCSGSMNGDSIEAARRALREIVAQFTARDRFSLSRFGSTVEHRSRGLWLMTTATQAATERWLTDLKADLGGTEMQAALQSTFALAQSARSDVLLITDGEISAIDSTIAAARASGHRVFVVGVGSSPAESHLRRLAEATGGACDFVAPGEAVQPAVLRMFARLRSARMSDLAVAWPEGAQVEWMTPLPQSVFDGDTINVFALLRDVPCGEVTFGGRRESEALPEVIGRAAIVAQPDAGPSLSRVAAATRLRTVDAIGTPLAVDEAERLAVDYQLVTTTTNFLLLHQRAAGEQATQMPELHQVAPMLAAGWGGQGRVHALEQKAHGRRINASTANFDADFDAPAPMSVASPLPDYDAPPVIRRGRSAPLNDAMEFRDIDPRSIPNFLRKGLETIDRRNARYWSSADHYRGLTPLGFTEWLNATPERNWPGTFEALHLLGIGDWVIEWLQITFGERDGVPIPESEIVGAFVEVMAQPEVRESLLKSGGIRENFTRVAQAVKVLLRGRKKSSRRSADERLVAAILLALQDMTAEAWPDSVFAMG